VPRQSSARAGKAPDAANLAAAAAHAAEGIDPLADNYASADFRPSADFRAELGRVYARRASQPRRANHRNSLSLPRSAPAKFGRGDKRGLSAIAITQTATESAKAMPIAAGVPHAAQVASDIAAPPKPVPSAWPNESVNCIEEATVPAEYSLTA
jgi:hypothetical protein